LRERGEARLPHGIIFIERHEHADAPHARALLRARRERPAAEERDSSASNPQKSWPIHGPLIFLEQSASEILANP
jgi:hypothetical protein